MALYCPRDGSTPSNTLSVLYIISLSGEESPKEVGRPRRRAYKPDRDVACKLPFHGRANLASLLPGADQKQMLGLAVALSSLVLRRLVVLTRKFKGCEGIHWSWQLVQIGCPNSQRCPSLMVSSKAEAMRLQLVIRPACPCNAIHENTLPSTHAMPALAAFERTCSVALAGAGIISLAVAVTSLMRASACRVLMH